MSDFITDVEQQYEVYCKIAEDYGFIDFNAKKNGFRCTTKSNEFNAGWIAFTGAIAAMREDQQAEIDQLNAELALCREENKGLVGKVSVEKKRVEVALQVIFNCRAIGADRIYTCDAVEKCLRGEHESNN